MMSLSLTLQGIARLQERILEQSFNTEMQISEWSKM
jgi:hypothetical protein